jgi:RNA 3'-terminal phosphate cyclase (ATP)
VDSCILFFPTYSTHAEEDFIFRVSLFIGGRWLNLITIDGSILEGGGQILRVSTALSAATGIPVRIVNIRARRTAPGLQSQHLVAIRALTQISNAELKGGILGSSEIEFTPRQIRAGDFSFDIGTAGSTTLVMQALMPALAYASGKVTVEVKGGTNNPFAPPIEFLQNVLLPNLRRLGYEASVELMKRGFYPKGGGMIKAILNPVKRLEPLVLVDQGKVVKVRGFSFSSRLPPNVTERMSNGAKVILSAAGYHDVCVENERREHWDPLCALNAGSGIFVFAETTTGALMSGDALGKKSVPDQTTGMDAARDLLRQLSTGAEVDRHLTDQLIIWAAMANGTSILRTTQLTGHTLTCLEISKTIIGTKFQIEGRENEPALITIEGKGIQNTAAP